MKFATALALASFLADANAITVRSHSLAELEGTRDAKLAELDGARDAKLAELV